MHGDGGDGGDGGEGAAGAGGTARIDAILVYQSATYLCEYALVVAAIHSLFPSESSYSVLSRLSRFVGLSAMAAAGCAWVDRIWLYQRQKHPCVVEPWPATPPVLDTGIERRHLCQAPRWKCRDVHVRCKPHAPYHYLHARA